MVTVYGWLLQSLHADKTGRTFIQAGPPLAEQDLPSYTILLPLYREAEVASQLIQAICNLDYPRKRMQVLCVVRPTDEETLRALTQCGVRLMEKQEHVTHYTQAVRSVARATGAASAADARTHIQILLLPPELPIGTKPAALNWGLAHATGEILVVYDAEDVPAPDQLRLAAAALYHAPPALACVEAPIYACNGATNTVTSFIDLEMLTWNRLALPGYVAWEKLAPLFGTSGHFRTDILCEQNGWDYYNVTEDWELCIRLQQNSYHIALLDSVTHNAVVTSYGTFLRQRTRWIKGFLQTFFLQTQNPATLVRSLGWWRSMAFVLKSGLNVFNLMIGLATRIVPLLWLGLYYFRAGHIPSPTAILVSIGLGLSLVFLCLTMAVPLTAIILVRRWRLVPYALLMPVYWVLLSIAAWRGMWQLLVGPPPVEEKQPEHKNTRGTLTIILRLFFLEQRQFFRKKREGFPEKKKKKKGLTRQERFF